MAQERKLGRGFDSLLEGGTEGPNFATEEVLHLSLKSICPNRFQPRRQMAGDSFENLKASIARDGILQPVVVRPASSGYELIAGERRWRAASELGMEVIPAIIRQADDEKALELALIENIQREDLNHIDRAMAYKQLMVSFNLTQEEAAARVGQERSTVANTLRLLELPEEVQDLIRNGSVSLGHAKVLLGVRTPDLILELAKRVAEEGVSVRELETLVTPQKRGRPRARKAKAPEIVDLEERLRRYLATKVEIAQGGKQGRITVEYYNSRDLERILERIGLK